jgi:hypothetical protein
MSTTKVDVRPLHRNDFNAVVEIDEKVFELACPEYYQTNWSTNQFLQSQ